MKGKYTISSSRWKIALTVLFLPCLLLFLNGCAVGPDYCPPKVSVPTSWSELPQEGKVNPEPLAQWWKTFNDPVLDSLIVRAVPSNLDLRIAEARVREARFQRGAVASDLWPSLNTSASYSRSRRSVGISTIPPSARIKRNLYETGFDASWEIDLFGGKRRAVEAAGAEIDAAVENQRDALITLLAEVARNYIEVRGYQRRLQIIYKNISTQQEAVEIVQAR
ncbi:MAG: NodT protein, partial [Planctomycetes bacterium]|nr:NodT protein [Planctomycetota bacterium]